MDQAKVQVCPLLRSPDTYNPDTIDLINNETERRYWLPCLGNLVRNFVDKAERLNPGNPDAKEKAEICSKKFQDLVSEATDNPKVLSPLSIRTLLEFNEDNLRENSLKDAWLLQKERDTKLALQVFKERIWCIDGIEDFGAKWLDIVEGVLAGNVFDWGSTLVADILENTADFGLVKARDVIEKRPWFVDDLDSFIRRLEENPYRKIVIFVDNAGVDFILGILPLVREFLKMNTRVVLTANSLPALNDVTIEELRSYCKIAAHHCPTLENGLNTGLLSAVANGQKGPCLDLSKLAPGHVMTFAFVGGGYPLAKSKGLTDYLCSRVPFGGVRPVHPRSALAYLRQGSVLQYKAQRGDDTSSSSEAESEDENIMVLRRGKIYRTRQRYFAKYDDIEFFQHFRLTKPTVLALLQHIAPLIALPTNRGGCIQPAEQLLVTLRFYALGNFLRTSGDFMGISTTSTCRIVRRVSSAIASLRPQYVKMYTSNEEMQMAAEDFYSIASFPRVIGIIDCTLIRMDSVGGEDAEIYRCRKGFFALNVQTVCDAQLKIRDIVARWPGSCHDQTIFNNSRVKQQFEEGIYGNYLLIGDSGYQLERYLMTKLRQVQNEAENLYNESILRTRNIVERVYGVWKRRFPVLHLGMRLKLETIMAIIVATAVLHNIAVEMNDAFPPEWLENLEDLGQGEGEGHDVAANIRMAPLNVQRLLVTEHFGNL